MRLVAEGLGGERGGRLIFSGVEFSLDDGESLVVTGPNGAGKSTLLRVVAGLLPVASGNVRIEGGDEGVAGSVHYLGHLNAMKPTLTVAENLRFWTAFLGSPMLSLEDALDRVGLAAIAHLPFGFLSTGQRRRAAIARLLVSRRPVWLLDEPTAGLDADSERRFLDIMLEHLAAGGIIMAATHLPLDLREASQLRLRGQRRA
jgi:heme exporter protein A